jgi:hypothetical protein
VQEQQQQQPSLPWNPVPVASAAVAAAVLNGGPPPVMNWLYMLCMRSLYLQPNQEHTLILHSQAVQRKQMA